MLNFPKFLAVKNTKKLTVDQKLNRGKRRLLYMPPKGLANLGNTCYFASAIQCLSHVPELTNHLLRDPYEGDCEVTREYAKLLKNMWRNKDLAYVTPREFHDAFTKKYPSFRNLQPHDVQEVVLSLIDTFEKSLGADFVKGIFNGTETREVVYPKGVSKKDAEMTTVVVMPTKQNQTLDELMKHREGCDAFGGYVDDDGNSWHAAVTRTYISIVPSILIVSFNQYDAKYAVRVPQRYENIRELFGLVVHHGSTRGGHYAVYVKHRGVWRYIDDDVVTEKDPPESGEYYMAFFKSVR